MLKFVSGDLRKFGRPVKLLTKVPKVDIDLALVDRYTTSDAKTDLPTQENQARPQTRFPGSYFDQNRPSRFSSPPGQGPRQTDGLMLPKANRLNLAREFRRFKERGRSLDTPFFRFNYLPTSGVPRFGFVVTNKIGKATERNRARRILREVVKSRIEVMPPIEAVFIGRNRLPGAKYEEVLASFDQVLAKIK